MSFTVAYGRITGFLGPNGAGKTTTLRMMLGLIRPDAGTAVITGKPYAKLASPARTVGALLDAAAAHPGRTGRDHLRVLAAPGRDTRPPGRAAAGRSAWLHAAQQRAGGYSLGMRQRLGLAAALLGDPEVLVLDEPGNGLDPQGIRWLRDLLRSLAAEGRAVLVSSHILAEVAQTADDVVVISHGRTITQAPLPRPAGHPPRRHPGRHLPRTDRHHRRRTVMTGLIRAETLRLATTRTYWLLAAGAIAVIAGGIAPPPRPPASPPAPARPAPSWLSPGWPRPSR